MTMGMQFTIIHLMISIVLFFVLFFGIAFILNMLLRMTWFMAFIYPIVVLFIVNKIQLLDYVHSTGKSFQRLWTDLTTLAVADIIILFSGLLGTIAAGFTMKTLRKRGYRMF
jgi:hypothetical protein